MWSLATLEAMHNKVISYTHREVAKCRARCNKRCCINCDNFLSTEINENKSGQLLELICVKREGKIQTWAGPNECEYYLVSPKGGWYAKT